MSIIFHNCIVLAKFIAQIAERRMKSRGGKLAKDKYSLSGCSNAVRGYRFVNRHQLDHRPTCFSDNDLLTLPDVRQQSSQAYSGFVQV